MSPHASPCLPASLRISAEIMLDFVSQVRKARPELAKTIRVLNIGGGLGIDYHRLGREAERLAAGAAGESKEGGGDAPSPPTCSLPSPSDLVDAIRDIMEERGEGISIVVEPGKMDGGARVCMCICVGVGVGVGVFGDGVWSQLYSLIRPTLHPIPVFPRLLFIH